MTTPAPWRLWREQAFALADAAEDQWRRSRAERDPGMSRNMELAAAALAEQSEDYFDIADQLRKETVTHADPL